MGKIDVPLIMKIIALIASACAVGINVGEWDGRGYRITLVSNSFLYAAGAYLIIIGFFFFWTIIKSEVDKKFAGIVLICGGIWLIGAGIGVLVFHIDYELQILQLVGGILGLAAGVVLFIDGLHNLGVF